ncbi:MAG: glycosyltransferase family 1 protein [Bacteroidetes bacterium]|nr:glycosyltransferase family 1 protein [Bacteroidota bacterium]
MPDKHLNIISFDIPFPANYGGVIDVYYKIKALHDRGVKIHLHCFYKNELTPGDELNKLCDTINYYPRTTGWKSFFSLKPYIVKSRESQLLLENLLKNDYPILFEGIHTTSLLNHPQLAKRLKIFRPCNIEHHYYFQLFWASRKLFEKPYFLCESIKLKSYQPIIRHANIILAITDKDKYYLQDIFTTHKVILLPGFYPGDEPGIIPGKGDYALYHGNLSIAENAKAVRFLIKKVFSKTNYPLKIAGFNPDKQLINLVSKYPHISIIKNPDNQELIKLIQDAQMNLMFTFQSTGLKLKLLYALNYGRFCIANEKMLDGSRLHILCLTAEKPIEILGLIKKIKDQEFSKLLIDERMKHLPIIYSNKKNAEIIIGLLG